VSQTRSEILSFLAVYPEPVTLPGGRTVHVRRWTAAERQAFQREHKADAGRLYERLFVASVCDEAGNRLFTPADLDAVGHLDGAALEAVAVRVLQLNGLADDSPDPSTASRN
jgi:hypothetical protein